MKKLTLRMAIIFNQICPDEVSSSSVGGYLVEAGNIVKDYFVNCNMVATKNTVKESWELKLRFRLKLRCDSRFQRAVAFSKSIP